MYVILSFCLRLCDDIVYFKVSRVVEFSVKVGRNRVFFGDVGIVSYRV